VDVRLLARPEPEQCSGMVDWNVICQVRFNMS
jgi:hypothetical protein